MDTHYGGKDDQPTQCPKCGTRTGFEVIDESGSQVHSCGGCGYEFILTFI